MSAAPILAAFAWPTNAELIADCHTLGYLRDGDHVLDPTFENGVWWKAWRPEKLTTHHRAEDGSDFRSLPYPDGTFDAVAYDPPYVCPGGRKTSTIKEMHDRYGMNEGGFEDPAFSTPAELQALINEGLTEMHRLARPSQFKKLHPTAPNGVVLVKVKDYIWSGQFFPGTHHTLVHALTLGFTIEDRFEMFGDPGPQPLTRPVCANCGYRRRKTDTACLKCGEEETADLLIDQVHARRNLSTLFVLRRAA